MTDKHQHDEVRSRNEPFVAKAATRICQEIPSASNPFIAKKVLCQGYDLVDLMANCSYVDMFYLLFRGELPSPNASQLLQALMVALINPGPRHPATRAALNVGVGKSNPAHILPIASALLGGEYQGGGDIDHAMRFFRKNQKTSPTELIRSSKQSVPSKLSSGSYWPGFGEFYGGINELANSVAEHLVQLPGAGDALKWGDQLAQSLKPENQGWLMPGVAAAVFADLGFQPRVGVCLFQLLSAPGTVAHGMELANKPITAMPYVSDDNYVIERE